MICHLVGRAEWGTGADSYRPASLASEGFIHFSTPDQVVATADRYYPGRTDLLLVVVDPDRLSAPLRWEAPAAASAEASPTVVPAVTASPAAPPAAAPAAGEAFPHLYGPFATAAVVTVLPFPPGADGRFTVPPTLW